MSSSWPYPLQPQGPGPHAHKGIIASCSVNMVRDPQGSYVVIPIAASGVATPNNTVTHWSLSSISKKVGPRCQSPFHERFLEGCSSPFIPLAEHLTARRAWCKQCLPGWWTPNVLRPGIVGMRGSMIIRLRPCTNWPSTRTPMRLQRSMKLQSAVQIYGWLTKYTPSCGSFLNKRHAKKCVS